MIARVFDGEEGMSCVVTTESSNIDELKEAAEKYGVHIPKARFTFLCYGDAIEMHYGLEGYGRTEWAHTFSWIELNKAVNLPEDNRENASARRHIWAIIEAVFDALCWESILTGYLAEKGIDYIE